MESFADEQPKEIAEKLYRALNGNKPFAHFRAVVETLGLLQDWYAFQNAWYKEKAEEWMLENGVDFKNGKVVASRHSITWKNDD